MKKVIVMTTALLLAGLASSQAQSTKPVNQGAGQSKTTSGNASKNTLSQAQGQGVPYSQSAGAKKNNHNIPSPSVTTGPDAKATGQFSVGSHTAQRENKMGHQTKRKDPIPKSNNQ